MKKGLLITGGLVTAFLVSFSASAYFMMNAKDLVFAKDKQEVSELTQQLESKDTEIADLKEQVERYQTLYTAAIAGKRESGDTTSGSSATKSPSGTQAPASTKASGTTTKPTRTVSPTETPAATKTPTKAPESTQTPENTRKPTAPDESNTSADE
ncbi:hypothetical protein [Acetivibrio sp. MSJd-27]|uniref:hypothetical protein n=1 Tax=Acetivibrio sp. MSJd-27 TaxID=2841523 RepID=UPI001C1112CE|nr:hypothetical protein [Acetivibrio sp. MSJd-27]MBU5451027.1 hypothetical protein [Acetivibrio sp. MSJd-27]